MLRLVAACLVTPALLGACSIDQTDDGTAKNASGSGASTTTSSGSGALTTVGGAGGGTVANASASTSTGSGDYQGTIACGSSQCTLPSEMCCNGVCQSSTVCAGGVTNGKGHVDGSVAEYCDDSSDCGMRSCCVTVDFSGIIYQCASDCGGGWESCVFGGTTCDQGLCVADPTAAGSFARCDPAASIPCGAASCSGATPVCCVSGGSSSCTGLGGCSGAAYLCASRTECGANAQCCENSSGSACADACSPTELVLCASVAECPPNAAGALATGCAAPSGATPAGLKACIY